MKVLNREYHMARSLSLSASAWPTAHQSSLSLEAAIAELLALRIKVEEAEHELIDSQFVPKALFPVAAPRTDRTAARRRAQPLSMTCAPTSSRKMASGAMGRRARNPFSNRALTPDAVPHPRRNGAPGFMSPRSLGSSPISPKGGPH